MKYTMIVGVDFDKDGKPLDAEFVTQVLIDIKKRLSQRYGGVTSTVGRGGYLGRHGYTEEVVAKLEVFDQSDGSYASFLALAKELKKYLNQESILFGFSKEDFTLI